MSSWPRERTSFAHPPTILMATSPIRFRVEGMGANTFVDFQITDGGIAITLPCEPAGKWERSLASGS